jgi:hypothetical protein
MVAGKAGDVGADRGQVSAVRSGGVSTAIAALAIAIAPLATTSAASAPRFAFAAAALKLGVDGVRQGW